jgi:hypothetical protein
MIYIVGTMSGALSVEYEFGVTSKRDDCRSLIKWGFFSQILMTEFGPLKDSSSE